MQVASMSEELADLQAETNALLMDNEIMAEEVRAKHAGFRV